MRARLGKRIGGSGNRARDDGRGSRDLHAAGWRRALAGRTRWLASAVWRETTSGKQARRFGRYCRVGRRERVAEGGQARVYEQGGEQK